MSPTDRNNPTDEANCKQKTEKGKNQKPTVTFLSAVFFLPFALCFLLYPLGCFNPLEAFFYAYYKEDRL
jgi:hypothetical protein